MIRTIEWRDDAVVMLDQRLLPTREVYNTYRTHDEVACAIKDMVIRGAPAIGVAAALGVALGMRQAKGNPERALERICAKLAATRPTAVNLAWALARMRRTFVANRNLPLEQLRQTLLDEALAIRSEDIEACRAMGRLGAELIPAGACVMTHCNAGALATAGYGTALGVIRAAHEAGKGISVITNETRPFLQGARLTAWELVKEKIPATLITDNMAGSFLKAGRVDCIVVGADRIAANGDVANKIGTYPLAVLAQRHRVPFYVAAPLSTIDLACPDGDAIPIEQRHPDEVSHCGGQRVAAKGVGIANPAFDVTPNDLVSAIITECGIARRPYRRSLARLG